MEFTQGCNADTTWLDARTMGRSDGHDRSALTERLVCICTVSLVATLRSTTATQPGKSYMSFKPNMLLPADGTGKVTAIADPFGNSYGYSTCQRRR